VSVQVRVPDYESRPAASSPTSDVVTENRKRTARVFISELRHFAGRVAGRSNYALIAQEVENRDEYARQLDDIEEFVKRVKEALGVVVDAPGQTVH
jgi:hypothetical protein